MPTHAPLAPQIEQFIHDNPQGVLTSFRRNGMPQLIDSGTTRRASRLAASGR